MSRGGTGAQIGHVDAVQRQVADDPRDPARLQLRLPPGLDSYQVVNEGPQIHELNLLKLAPGTTADKLLAFLDAPDAEPPFTSAGGIQAIRPGGSGSVTLDLQPGTCAAVCHVPDASSGVPHLDLGMIKVFTVK